MDKIRLKAGKERIITLSHGSGGRKMQQLISETIMKYFSNPILARMDDGAIIGKIKGRIVVTTDSFVIAPRFFSGGNIGKLSICGTINDLTAMGAKPRFITAGFIIEEGLPVAELEIILSSMRKESALSGVIIAAGDTKVVEKGKADGIFINTTGIGEISGKQTDISSSNARPGDAIIISGTIGDHEIAILKERNGLGFESNIKSDCASLFTMVEPLLKAGIKIHVMRDPTRGGMTAVLNELAISSGCSMRLDEDAVPVNNGVKAACAMFGFDMFSLANEGKMIFICDSNDSAMAIKLLRSCRYGKKAAVIGRVEKKNNAPKVILNTKQGGARILIMQDGGQLPRIC